MKRFIATTLLFGYIMLVPFCFFGGAMASDMEGMNMLGMVAHEMSDCGMPIGACAGTATGAMGDVAQHTQMYLSLTQTPLTILSFLMTALVALFLVVFFAILPSRDPRVQFVRVSRYRETTAHRSHDRFLTWLSLFESSPNFA